VTHGDLVDTGDGGSRIHVPSSPTVTYRSVMLLAEAFVLLALNPDGTPARGLTAQSAVKLCVTAALLTALSQDGHLDLSDGRIRLTGTTPTHPLLQQVLDNVRLDEGKKLKNRLAQLRHSGWNEVVDLMVEEGLLGRETRTMRPTRHPVLCSQEQDALLRQVRSAATGIGPMDDRTATLLALAGPGQLLEVVAPDRADRAAARTRIKEAADRVPAAAAVKSVIDATDAAIGAAVILNSG
jgi:hypothetical protein